MLPQWDSINSHWQDNREKLFKKDVLSVAQYYLRAKIFALDFDNNHLYFSFL